MQHLGAMKRLVAPGFVVFLASFALTGCLGLNLGGGTKNETHNATLGQQLVDLQEAKNSGAISEAEFQTQKARLLAN